MRLPSRCAAGAVTCLFFIGYPAAGQLAGYLGMGASYLDYDGFLPSGAGVLTPALRFDSPALTLAGEGQWTMFESGNSVLQGTVAGAWRALRREGWRFEVFGAAGRSRYANEPSTGHLLAGGRLHLLGRRSGGWMSASLGRTSGELVSNPVELSLAAWTVHRRIALLGLAVVSLTADQKYLELQGAVRWNGRPFQIEARSGVRPMVRTLGGVGNPGTDPYLEVVGEARLSERATLLVDVGSYPSDPTRGVLGASYAHAGLRFRAFGGPPEREPLLERRFLDRPVPEGTAPARILFAKEGHVMVIRVQAGEVALVELMGDFTDWAPVTLDRVSRDRWEVALAIPPGVHRFNIRLDRGDWTVPRGARSEPTEYGGTVGIVVVP